MGIFSGGQRTAHLLLVQSPPERPYVLYELAHRRCASVPTRDDTDAAAGLLAGYSDQRLTQTDALIASMAAREGVPVLTFDERHFSLMGAQPYP